VFHTRADICAGAPYYMAPEVLRGEPPSVSSDIYAFGLVIDEMVTRSRAFTIESHQALYQQKLQDGAVPPGARSSDLPPAWEQAILRCIESEPARRYASAFEVYQELAGTDAPPRPASRPFAVVATQTRQSVQGSALRSLAVRRRRLIPIAIAIPVLGGFVALSSIVSRPLNTSVVVYPTTNLSSRTEYDYLCKGTTNELIRRLSQVRQLRIIPVYEPRAKAPRSPENVRFSLDSQLQESGQRVRFSVQLMENRDGTVVWSSKFDRELGDPLELQSDIAGQMVEAMEARVVFGASAQETRGPLALAGMALRRYMGLEAALPRPPTTSSAALESYMRGRDLWDERSVPAALAAMQYFERALKEDPKFSLAYAAMADTLTVLMEYNYAPAVGLLSRARTFAEQAVAIGPDVAENYVSLAAVRQVSWDWKRAEDNYRTAIRLHPALARAHLVRRAPAPIRQVR
jgi:TolB-like protein